MNTEEIPSSPSPDRQADERLIHALLLHHYDQQAAEHRERRLARAMAVLRPAARRSRWSLAGRPMRFGAIAAMLLICAGLGIYFERPTPALAALTEMQTALESPGDRTYRIQMVDLPQPPGQKAPEEPEKDPQGRVIPKPGLDRACLYLRDAREYLLVRVDERGGERFDGYDGKQSWRLSGGREPEIREGLGAGGIPMPAIMADVPFADLAQTLARIGQNYSLELSESTAEARRYIRARRHSRWVKGPETIEIWAEGSKLRKIVFDDAKIHGNPAACRVTLELTSQEKLAADWFAPAGHVTPSGGQDKR